MMSTGRLCCSAAQGHAVIDGPLEHRELDQRAREGGGYLSIRGHHMNLGGSATARLSGGLRTVLVPSSQNGLDNHQFIYV